MKKITQTLMFIILIASCADNDILPDKPFNGNAAEVDSIRTVGELPEDSLNIKYMMQTNSDLIISDRIIYKNSIYVLDLSLEEAKQLSISDDMYQKYIEIVSNMNKDNKEH